MASKCSTVKNTSGPNQPTSHEVQDSVSEKPLDFPTFDFSKKIFSSHSFPIHPWSYICLFTWNSSKSRFFFERRASWCYTRRAFISHPKKWCWLAPPSHPILSQVYRSDSHHLADSNIFCFAKKESTIQWGRDFDIKYRWSYYRYHLWDQTTDS